MQCIAKKLWYPPTVTGKHPRPDSGFYVEMRDILDEFRQELTELRTFRETLEDLTSRVARIEQKLGHFQDVIPTSSSQS